MRMSRNTVSVIIAEHERRRALCRRMDDSVRACPTKGHNLCKQGESKAHKHAGPVTQVNMKVWSCAARLGLSSSQHSTASSLRMSFGTLGPHRSSAASGPYARATRSSGDTRTRSSPPSAAPPASRR